MKKINLLICFIAISITMSAQSIGIGIGTTTPDASAMLDVTSNNKGMLVPRMTTAQRAAIATPAAGLLVYDSDTNSFWFYNGSAWSNLSASGTLGWLLTGNGGTNPASDFIGTTDNLPLRFKLNNTLAGELHPTTGNIFFGLRVGQANTTSFSNIAIGIDALNLNTSRSNLVAIGDSALYNNGTSATQVFQATANTAIGSKALYSNTTGYQNTANGYRALYNNAAGRQNTATGYNTLYSNTAGIQNTANGHVALSSNSTGNDNTANGYAALSSNTTGYENTANGAYALSSNTTAIQNTAIGTNALSTQSYNPGGTWSSNNVAVGYSSLYSNQPTSTANGISNTAVGTYALRNNTIGFANTANGYETLRINTFGNYNTALGYQAGSPYINLNNTTCIGNGATASNDNQIVLGNANVTEFYCYGAFIGTTANAANLTVLPTGQIARSTSSRRYKKDIEPIEINTANIYKLKPVSYNSYTDDSRHFGLIAEEVAEVIPELAMYSKEKDVVKGSSSEKMIPDAVQYPLLSVLILKEVQKHKQTIMEQQSIIEEQNKKIELLLKEIQLIKEQLNNTIYKLK